SQLEPTEWWMNTRSSPAGAEVTDGEPVGICAAPALFKENRLRRRTKAATVAFLDHMIKSLGQKNLRKRTRLAPRPLVSCQPKVNCQFCHIHCHEAVARAAGEAACTNAGSIPSFSDCSRC